MIAKKRLSLAILSSLLAELVGKILPLAILSIGQRRLGIESFGFAMVGVTLLEFSFPFITFGYNQYGTIQWGKIAADEERRQLVRDLWALKSIHAFVALLVLVVMCATSTEYRPYLTLVLALSFSLWLSVVECLWIQVATQKIAVFGVFNIIAKVASFLCIYMWVNTPADSAAYAIFILGANCLVCVLTTVASRKWISFGRPRFSLFWPIFTRVKGYAAVAIWMIWMDRLDLLWVNHQLGLHEVGLYAGASRLNQALLQLIWILSWVFFSEAVVAVGKKSLSHHLQLATFTVFSLLAPIVVGIFFFAKDFLTLLVGPAYEGMALPLSLLVVGSVGTAGILLLGQQVLQLREAVGKMFAALTVGFFVTTLIFVFATPHWGMVGVAAGQLGGKIVAAALMIYWARPFLTRLPWREVGTCFGPAAFMGLGLFLFPQSHWIPRMLLAFGTYGVSFLAMNHRRLRGWQAGLGF
jgi:O-antigen/teichoic acid export membrane protein